ncbi:mitochondrial carrier domain-containing protein [Tribonema minus]|uniref:Mitochondrial carrier domain-containing protein n=1 Tax=Tribonema minus TaxID=303371 RepID=A0A835Z3L6_9STRA|nr:mitochondrial carrier domain-containing protein [Tribonema minus]
MPMAAAGAEAPPVDIKKILSKSAKRALGGGASGAAAAGVQVLSLMWLRTTMNYQYRNGGSTVDALTTLYAEGGVPRLYRGLPFALLQGPLSRFGDTAANAGVIALLDALPATQALPLPLKSAGGSIAAGLWRIALTPIDTIKTTLQVVGEGGGEVVLKRLQAEGPSALFQGAVATSVATMVGHYPWYLTYNALGEWLPMAPAGDELLRLGRAALMGVCASSVSDCCSNSIRVIKTAKQTSPEQITYTQALKSVLDEGGVPGLFGRGLQTRLVANGLQGALFSVLWKFFETKFAAGSVAAATAVLLQ